MSRSLWVLGLSLIFSIVACTKKSTTVTPEREVSLAIWANYLSPEVQERFTRETGIKIKVSNYSSNEELLAKVQAGATGIDVAVPSDYMVEVMAKQNLLQSIDGAKVKNREGLEPALLKQEYDPENRFSLPYAWSTAGIAVNRDLFKGPVKSWKDLFQNKELAGKILLLDDAREVTAAALKMLGYSVNTTSAAELEKAKQVLKDVRPRVKMFRSDTSDPMADKEVAIGHVYSSDAFMAARKSGGAVEYILPEEGGTRAIDNLVILKGAKDVEAAHRLIDFMLAKESNVSFVKTTMGGPVLQATRELLPPEIKSNAALFPSPAVLAKFERIKDVGEATRLYDRLWTEVKAE